MERILTPGFTLLAVRHSVLATGMHKSILSSKYYSPWPIMSLIYDLSIMQWVLRIYASDKKLIYIIKLLNTSYLFYSHYTLLSKASYSAIIIILL